MSIFGHKEKDGTINYHVTGQLTRDPELKENAKGDKIKFSVAFGKSKYMNCEVWANSTAGRLAGCLEKGDHVAVDGVYEEWTYNDKLYSVLRVDFLQVQMDAPAPPETSAPEKDAEAPEGDDDGAANDLDEPDVELSI